MTQIGPPTMTRTMAQIGPPTYKQRPRFYPGVLLSQPSSPADGKPLTEITAKRNFAKILLQKLCKN